MSLGPAEILVILVVALIVFGPKRLPEVSRQVGGAMRELRRMQDSVRDELHSVMHGGDEVPGSASAPVHEIEAGADHDLHPDVHLDGEPTSPPGGSSSEANTPTNPTIDDHGPSGSFS
jgi:sec-independent protein translocase protein TatA